jgi:hypothetical protein
MEHYIKAVGGLSRCVRMHIMEIIPGDSTRRMRVRTRLCVILAECGVDRKPCPLRVEKKMILQNVFL